MDSRTGGSKARAFLRLFRLGNCVMGAFGTLLAVIICAGVSELEQYALETVLSMAVVVLFTAGGNSLNDYFDRETDKRAHPERPIPSGKLTPHEVVYAAVALFTLSVVASIAITVLSIAIVVTSILVILAYETRLKAEGFAGNMAIAWLTGALFLFGGAAVGTLSLAWILAALAFLATLGREIAKDIQDMEADRSSRRTLPMRIGVKSSGVVAAASFVAAVALSPLPYLEGVFHFWYVPVVAAADGIFIYCALILFQNPERGQRFAKLAMAVALVAFLVGVAGEVL
jgi:geranylgeranylglycerol-phosphate geranylgeranyltransferase